MDTGQTFLYAFVALLVGFQAWRWIRARSIPRYGADDIADRMRSGACMLVDVRTAAERSHLSIPGSVHIPLNQLATRLGELDRHRDKEMIFYCATGSRSIVAALRAKKHGLLVAHLDGGIATWQLSKR